MQPVGLGVSLSSVTLKAMDPTEMPDPEPVDNLGQGDPPTQMAERFGMESAPTEGASDETEGEVLNPDEAEADSERAMRASGETQH